MGGRVAEVSIIVPYRESDDTWRGCTWQHFKPMWRRHGEIIECDGESETFSRTQAIRDGVSKSSGDILVIVDCDVWCDPTQAIEQVRKWMVPHRLVHRLSNASTRRALAGEGWQHLELSQDNKQDRKPYIGRECGTMVVMTRDTYDTAPPDPRFVGWGSEDEAWSCGLRTLVGPPQRGKLDLVHFWHPAEPRLTRVVGNEVSDQLLQRYRSAWGDRTAMWHLMHEAALPLETPRGGIIVR